MSTLTLTVVMRKPAIMDAGPPMGILAGSVNISSYSTTHTAVTALTAYFKPSTSIFVACDNAPGYAIRFDQSTKDFFAYVTGAALSGVLAEAGNAAAVGTFNFIAFGQTG